MSRTELTAHAAVLSRRLEEVHPVMLAPAVGLMVVMTAVVALAMVVVLAAVVLVTGAAALLVCLERMLTAAADWRPSRRRTEVAA
ncbi:hypothetical protein [Streptomyces sp. XC 2026]|uniref:hypothetical protein n=1 Tax=Streptomyces sp. XC 2026 TaxID=2782004 RepID=UPI00190687E7|nr:hypothetical protein [Streptomyces sp. XC 2026]QQN79738.1 hypothetical protein IPZ77_21670 [Streptomyces sp. XC 2026]QQN80654.1 hypothetical protein IPZ77_26985 [Streptomyces sp. XC 2026]